MASHAKVDVHRTVRRNGSVPDSRICALRRRPALQMLRIDDIGEAQCYATAAGTAVAVCTGVQPPKTCVYILKTTSDRGRYYTGVTSDWRARLHAHNDGRCSHTARYRPWEVDVVIQFTDERRALAFERYLKSGSGCAFAKRHLRA